MALIERVQAILLRPRQTWPTIAAEPADVRSIYSRYLVFLAAIPAIAGFIGWTLIGGAMLGVSYRLPLATGLFQMVFGYLLSLGVVYVLALLVNALAPTFGGSKDLVAALKLVAYGSTAGFVGGIFNVLPALAWLGLIAAFYSIYLIYTGLPVLMRCPAEKAGVYTAVVVVCSVVAMIVVAGVSSLLVGGPPGSAAGTVGMAGAPGADGGRVQIKTPDGATVTIDSSAMADLGKRMEDAAKRMEPAQAPGGGSAPRSAGDLLGAAGGGSNVTPIAAADLQALLPEAIGEFKRDAVEAKGGEAMGFAGSIAKAAYVSSDRRAELAIADTAGLAGLATMAAWANVTMDKETGGKVEKVYREGARVVHEEYRKDGSRAELAVILANGVIVSAEGDKVDIATLKTMLRAIDLNRLETTQRVAKK